MAKMHENEFTIDEDLVRHLLQKQCPQWKNLSLAPILSSGTDNALFRLGDDYVVRLPRIDWATESIKKEYEWVPKISQCLKMPISEPFFKGAPETFYPWAWLIVRWNEGYTPPFENDSEYEVLAKDLACFLNELHSITLENGPLSRRGVPLKELNEETTQALAQLKDDIDTQLATSLWNQLASLPSWTKNPVWVHGDFLPGNILVRNNRLNAVIDFSDVGIGDPGCDSGDCLEFT
ncbi:aminoglycoside phosphotransferase [Legionella hackeliae]|uniref:aminoglycoside phosphotransferase family protein n=1 Tax=Legionella hackeliae TaxID=449 RepID=UPI000E137162|nr:aminoglycoside phosphotransferase family protein [Legionella hackeliae]STX46922.1 aminoglycoside phosphotransferase [Legionella hackeliae]